MGKYSRLTSPFLEVRFAFFSVIILIITIDVLLLFILSFNDPLAAMSPVFLKMFQNEMVEAGEGVLAVEDMSGESMEQLLKHIYTGSVDKLDGLKVEIVLELLNASNKVKSSRNIWN
jgi:hypothetical protein